MSIIAQMLERLFPKTQHRILLLGFDSSGRTTALYQMKLGEVVQTLPTIGFNVETVEYKRTEFDIWDVGGRDKIRPLWRHYYQNTDAIIFVVNSGRIEFAENEEQYRDELQKLLGEDELRDCILLVWANKQDLPDAITPSEVSTRLALSQLRSRVWNIFGTVALTGDGLFESMDWLHGALTQKKSKSGTLGMLAHKGIEGIASTVSTTPGDAEAPSAHGTAVVSQNDKPIVGLFWTEEANQLLQWLESEEENDDEVLSRFEDDKAKSWDHRLRLRVAWVALRRYGRKEAMRLVFHGVKRIMGEDFHETTTYFWMHMVHYAISATSNPTGDFKGFLLLNPQLANSNLILTYYSQQTLWQTSEAKTQVVLPDAKQLPSLLSSVDSGSGVALTGGPAKALSDDEFHERLLARTLPSWGHEVMLRAVWVLLRKEGRRKGGTSRILEVLQQAEGSGHNVTIAYFWLQMVTLCDAVAGHGDITFADFARLVSSKELLNPQLICKHYSDATLSAGAAEFALPDLKPLPSVVK